MAYIETTLPSLLLHHIIGFCNTKEEVSLFAVDISPLFALNSHRVQTVSKLRPSLYLWPPNFASSLERIYYEITPHVNVFSGRRYAQTDATAELETCVPGILFKSSHS
jgi:hypothetical protein